MEQDTVVSGLEAGLFTTDEELVIRSWNEWLVRATGMRAEEAVGRPLAALFPEIEARGLLVHFRRVVAEGVVEVLAPALHRYLIPCPPQAPSRRFRYMQQRVTIVPLRDGGRIRGTIVLLEDVTARLEVEHEGRPQGEPVEALVKALGEERWAVRRAAVEQLAIGGEDETVQTLLGLLREGHQDLTVLTSVLHVLTQTDADVTEPLVRLLGAPDVDLRIYAALALGERRDRRAIPALLRALEDPDANVRYHAIEALGKLRAAEAVEQLLQIVETRDFFLAFPALDALAQIGDPAVAPRLVPLLRDKALCAPAADALGCLGDAGVVGPLVALLSEPGAPVRTVARALAALYDRYEAGYGEGVLVADLARGAFEGQVVQPLLEEIRSAQGEDLRALALVLGWLEGPEVERALVQLLGEPSVQKEVVQALVRYGPRVTALLVEQLHAEEPATRRAAAVALGRIGDPAAVPALVEALSGDTELAIDAAGALAQIGDRRAFEPLLGLLGHPNAALRRAAIAALNSLGHPEMAGRVRELLLDPDPRVRESATRIAGYFAYPECLERLLERCEDGDEAVRCAALESVPYLEDVSATAILRRALREDTPRVRAAAARALGQVEGKEALESLLEALQDPDPWVRYQAVRSLERHASPEALDALARLVQGDPAIPVRAAAVEALGAIGGARAAALLAPLAEAEEADLARSAIAALGRISHPDALAPLLEALRSSDAARRAEAALALGKHGGAGTAELLQWAAAVDPDSRVVQAAVDALEEMGTPEAIAALISLTVEPGRREACVQALARLGREYPEALADGLRHPNPTVRCALVEALARAKHHAASELLAEALRDPHPSVRLAAVTAFRRLGNRRVERKLLALAREDPDPAVRRAAQQALGPWGEEG